MSTVPSKKNLVIKVVYGKDIRRWRYPSIDEYANLTNFVKNTFNLRVFYLQFVDDEEDRLTIASQGEFEDAVEFVNGDSRKSLKIFVTFGSLHKVPVLSDDGLLLCYCASRFEEMRADKAYGGCTVTCDICNQTCDSQSTVYHCIGGRNECHRHGYDLCIKCYSERIRSPNAAPFDFPQFQLPFDLPSLPAIPPVSSLLTLQLNDNIIGMVSSDDDDLYNVSDDGSLPHSIVQLATDEDNDDDDVDRLIEVENEMRLETEEQELRMYLDKLEEHLPLLQAFESEEEVDESEEEEDNSEDDDVDADDEEEEVSEDGSDEESEDEDGECEELEIDMEMEDDDVHSSEYEDEEDEEKVYAYMVYDEEQARADAVNRLLSHKPLAVNEERVAKAQAVELISMEMVAEEVVDEEEEVEVPMEVVEVPMEVVVDVKPPFKYESELNVMSAMGYNDVVRLQQMLLKFNGSIERVFMEM